MYCMYYAIFDKLYLSYWTIFLPSVGGKSLPLVDMLKEAGLGTGKCAQLQLILIVIVTQVYQMQVSLWALVEEMSLEYAFVG